MAIVPLVAVSTADAAYPIMEARHVTGEPGEITVRIMEIRLPPNTDIRYRISISRVHAVYVTPWKLRSDFVWLGQEYRTYGRHTLWSDPVTGSWYTHGPDCCAGPTWEFTARSDAAGTVSGETSYRWQADPGDGWMLSHYTIGRGVIKDLNSGLTRPTNSERITCEHFSRDHVNEVRVGEEPTHGDPTPRPLCEVRSPASWSYLDW